jgi:hypothetical protein
LAVSGLVKITQKKINREGRQKRRKGKEKKITRNSGLSLMVLVQPTFSPA